MGYFQLNGIPWQVEMFCSYAFEGLTLDATHAGTGMNGPGAIFLTPLKVSYHFRGPLSLQQMHTRGGLISSRE